MIATQILMQVEIVVGNFAFNFSSPQYLRKMQASVKNPNEAFVKEQRVSLCVCYCT